MNLDCLLGGRVPDCGGGWLEGMLENLKAALAVYFAWYNFCRIHRSIRMTPAMEAGVSDHVWSIEEIVEMAEGAMQMPGPRGPYKRKKLD